MKCIRNKNGAASLMLFNKLDFCHFAANRADFYAKSAYARTFKKLTMAAAKYAFIHKPAYALITNERAKLVPICHK